MWLHVILQFGNDISTNTRTQNHKLVIHMMNVKMSYILSSCVIFHSNVISKEKRIALSGQLLSVTHQTFITDILPGVKPIK